MLARSAPRTILQRQPNGEIAVRFHLSSKQGRYACARQATAALSVSRKIWIRLILRCATGCNALTKLQAKMQAKLQATRRSLRSPATNVAELARLRRENKQLLMDREILKTAAKFFAKQSP
jgi:transposase-like protein